MSRPAEHEINKELQWLGVSLGLFNLRDKDRSCFRIFIELLKSAKNKEPVSSDELAEKLGLTRGTVIHHLNNLMDRGLVIHDRAGYSLSVNNLSLLIDELHRDMLMSYRELKQVAKEIDRCLGL